MKGKLARRIVRAYADFDPYEYADSVDSFEDAVADIERLIEEHPQTIIMDLLDMVEELLDQ